MSINGIGGSDKLNPGVDLTERIPKNKLNSSNLDDQNADYRFNRDRLMQEEQVLVGKLASAIKGGGKINLEDYIIPLDTKERIPLILGDKGFPEPVNLKEKNFPEYPYMAKDGSMHPDMESVHQADASYYNAKGFLKPEKIDTGVSPYIDNGKYEIPLISQKPNQNLKTIPNPKK